MFPRFLCYDTKKRKNQYDIDVFDNGNIVANLFVIEDLAAIRHICGAVQLDGRYECAFIRYLIDTYHPKWIAINNRYQLAIQACEELNFERHHVSLVDGKRYVYMMEKNTIGDVSV